MTVRMVQHYALTDGEAQARPCRILTMNAQDSTCLVQTEDHWMPDSAYSLYASDFATRLLKEQHVAVTPGIAFGPHGEGFFRISYAASEADLREGIARIKKFMGAL